MKVYLRNLARKYLDSVGITSYHRHIVRAWVSYFIQGARKRRAKTLEFHSQFITRGDLVFDVGAHIGERTSLYLSLGAEVL